VIDWPDDWWEMAARPSRAVVQYARETGKDILAYVGVQACGDEDAQVNIGYHPDLDHPDNRETLSDIKREIRQRIEALVGDDPDPNASSWMPTADGTGVYTKLIAMDVDVDP